MEKQVANLGDYPDPVWVNNFFYLCIKYQICYFIYYILPLSLTTILVPIIIDCLRKVQDVFLCSYSFLLYYNAAFAFC